MFRGRSYILVFCSIISRKCGSHACNKGRHSAAFVLILVLLSDKVPLVPYSDKFQYFEAFEDSDTFCAYCFVCAFLVCVVVCVLCVCVCVWCVCVCVCMHAYVHMCVCVCHNPQVCDRDYIFLVCICDLFACVWTQGTLVYSLIRRTFVESSLNLTPETSPCGCKA